MKTPLDPLAFAKLLWPHVNFYNKQREVIYSVAENDETYVPAANMMGKDFVAAFIIIWFFMTRHPCRIVTSSAKEDHLRVLWGEVGRFVQSATSPLDAMLGGPLVMHHREIRKVVNGAADRFSYCVGMVASEDRVAAMQGHHVAETGDGIVRTLFVGDEASSMPDSYYSMCRTWARRILILGNTWPCSNFFYQSVKGRPGTEDKGGDIKADSNGHYLRKVIRIKGEDSPNVRYAMAQKKAGLEPTNEILIPGVLPYSEYVKRRKLWDPMQQCVGLDAEWYEGASVLLYPPEWLNRAETVALRIQRPLYTVKTIGVDPAEGGDSSCWTVADKYGVIELISLKTPDTNVIVSRTLALMQRYEVIPENVLFDAGGGGREHADRLRAMGHRVRIVAFGEAATSIDRFAAPIIRASNKHRREDSENRYAYKNRRAEMYGLLRQMLDPAATPAGFGIPAKYVEYRRQLAPIPLLYDEEGRLELPPKHKRVSTNTKVTMTDLIGHSPDEADSLVLAVYGLLRKPTRVRVGALR